MTDLRKAAQQALEALERSETTVQYEGFGMARRDAERKHQAAITSLKAALDQPAPQPVAWRAVGGSIWGHKGSEDDTPLYEHPPENWGKCIVNMPAPSNAPTGSEHERLP